MGCQGLESAKPTNMRCEMDERPGNDFPQKQYNIVVIPASERDVRKTALTISNKQIELIDVVVKVKARTKA